MLTMNSIWVLCTLFWGVSGLTLPMTKPDGSVDMSSVVNHVIHLENTASDCQTRTAQLESELQTTKTQLEVTKSELQTTNSELQVTKSDLQTTKSDLETVKSDLQTAKSDLQKTQSDLKDQQRRSDAEMSSLKDELVAVKAEVVMTTDEIIAAKAEIGNMKKEFLSLQANRNQTVLDCISHDVTSNTADIQSVKQALEMTNSSLETFVTEINDFNRNTTAVTTELQKQQQEVKLEISNLSSILAQIQSNVTFTVNDIYHFKDSVKVVQTQLNVKTSDINLMKSDVASLRRNVSDLEAATQSVMQIPQIFQAAIADLATTKSSLQDQQKQLTSINNSMNNQLQTIKSDLDLKTKTVAFSARLTTSGKISHYHVRFDQVNYNEGNGYDRLNGTFTAPVSGTYMFSVQLEMHGDEEFQHAYLHIKKSGIAMASVLEKTFSHKDDVTIPITTVMYVKQGEEVWVQSDEHIHIYGETGSHFVGALLSAY